MYYTGKLNKSDYVETYYPGVGPAQFVGRFYTKSQQIANSFGPYIVESDFMFKNPIRFTNIEQLNKTIWNSFDGVNINENFNVFEFLKSLGQKFKLKLICEGYDAVVFSGHPKRHGDTTEYETVVPLTLGK